MTGEERRDEQLIAELWREVRPNQLQQVEGLVTDVARLQDEPDDAAAWGRIQVTAHRLAGTLGTYRQQPAGDLAVELDGLVAGTEQPTEDQRRGTAALVAALHEAMQREAREQA